MRTTILAVLMLSSLAGSVAARPDGKGPRMGWVKEQLGLEQSQIAPVTEIVGRAREQHRAIIDRHMSAARPELEAVEAQTRSELSAVLNPDQLTRYDELVEQRRAWHEQRASGAPPWARHRHADRQ